MAVGIVQDQSRWIMGPPEGCRSLRWSIDDESEGASELIPGLPDDLAYECLVRAPLASHHHMSRVCKRWRRVIETENEKLQEGRMGRGVADKWICAVVRESGSGYRNRVRAFDTRSKTWISLPPMPDNRHARAVGQEVAVVRGKILVCGGWRDTPLDDVTIFDPLHNRWFSGPKMLSPRAHFVSGVINGRLYVAGGGNGKQPRSQGAECFDPVLNKWFPIPSLDVGISFCLGVSVGGKLFVQARGGEPRETRVFLPEFGLWSAFNSKMLAWPHRPHAVLGLGDHHDHDHNHDQVLYRADINAGKHELMCYDADKDEWTSLGTIVKGPRHRIHEILGIDRNLWAVADDLSVGVVNLDIANNSTTPSPLKFVNYVGAAQTTEERLICCRVLVR